MKPAAQRLEDRVARPRRAAPSYQWELGTKSVLAAFFALAVICALFFTFGYTIGKHAVPATFSLGGATPHPRHAQPPPPTLAPGVQPPNPTQLGAAESNQTPAGLNPAPAAANPPNPADAPANASANPTSTPPSTAASSPPPPTTANSQPAATTTTSSASSSSGVFEVQVFAGIAADADTLASALKTRGYPANVVAPAPGSADAFYRVQVGPYLTMAEAQAMRARLTADGYQAVIKQPQ